MNKKNGLLISVFTLCLMIISACNFFSLDQIKEEAGGSTKFTVTFNSMGGEEVPPQTVDRGKTITLPVSEFGGHPINYSGGTFGWWFTEEACITPWDFQNGTVTRNMTLYAKWNEDDSSGNYVHSVVFFANEGLFSGGVLFMIRETATTIGTNMPANPSRTDAFVFNNWNTEADGLGSVFSGSINVTASIAVYATWTEPGTITDDPGLSSVTVAGNRALLGTPNANIPTVAAGSVGLLDTQLGSPASIDVEPADSSSTQTYVLVKDGEDDPEEDDFEPLPSTLTLDVGDTIWIKSEKGEATLYYAIVVSERQKSSIADLTSLTVGGNDGVTVTLTGRGGTDFTVSPVIIPLRPNQIGSSQALSLVKNDNFSNQWYMIDTSSDGTSPPLSTDDIDNPITPTTMVSLVVGNIIWIWSQAENEVDELFYAIEVEEAQLNDDPDLDGLTVSRTIDGVTFDKTVVLTNSGVVYVSSVIPTITIQLKPHHIGEEVKLSLDKSDPGSTQKYMIQRVSESAPPPDEYEYEDDIDQDMDNPTTLVDGDIIWIWSSSESKQNYMFYAVIVQAVPFSTDAVVTELVIAGVKIPSLIGNTISEVDPLGDNTIILKEAQLQLPEHEIILTPSDTDSPPTLTYLILKDGSRPDRPAISKEMSEKTALADGDVIWIYSIAEDSNYEMFYTVKVEQYVPSNDAGIKELIITGSFTGEVSTGLTGGNPVIGSAGDNSISLTTAQANFGVVLNLDQNNENSNQMYLVKTTADPPPTGFSDFEDANGGKFMSETTYLYNGDIIWIRSISEDESETLYYKISVTVS